MGWIGRMKQYSSSRLRLRLAPISLRYILVWAISTGGSTNTTKRLSSSGVKFRQKVLWPSPRPIWAISSCARGKMPRHELCWKAHCVHILRFESNILISGSWTHAKRSTIRQLPSWSEPSKWNGTVWMHTIVWLRSAGRRAGSNWRKNSSKKWPSCTRKSVIIFFRTFLAQPRPSLRLNSGSDKEVACRVCDEKGTLSSFVWIEITKI